MAAIFINIEEILRVNLNFLSKLKPAVMQALGEPEALKGDPLDVASLFIRFFLNFMFGQLFDFFSFKMNFTIYAIYCSNLEASRNRIDELERTEPTIRRIIAVSLE